MGTNAYIAMGSNLGDRQGHLVGAASALAGLPETRLVDLSRLHETAPVGGPAGQGSYLNAVAELETELPPRTLLSHLLSIERWLGRDRSGGVKNGPRTVDLDLLIHGGWILNEPRITVPHPRLHERAFVLEPFAEVAPTVMHPVYRKPIGRLYAGLPARLEVETQLGTLPLHLASWFDFETVRAILIEAADWLRGRGVEQWEGFRTEAGHENLRKRIVEQDVYLASLDGRSVGTVTLQWDDRFFWGKRGDDGRSGYVHGLAVRREVAGKGVGAALLQWAEGVFRSHGRARARLDCVADNRRINAYYQRLGYGPRELVAGDGWKARLYEKVLT